MMARGERDEALDHLERALEALGEDGFVGTLRSTGEVQVLADNGWNTGDQLAWLAADLAHVPAGEYWVQAVLHKYETFNLSTGHTVKLPMDRGEGQHWNRAPGNLYSTPERMRVDPASAEVLRITLDQIIPPILPPEDTKYIKHVKIESKLLSEFWGRPMFLGAHVLVPA